MQGGCKPVWRLLYEPPLKKHAGVVQRRILHEVLDIISLVSKISPAEHAAFSVQTQSQ